MFQVAQLKTAQSLDSTFECALELVGILHGSLKSWWREWWLTIVEWCCHLSVVSHTTSRFVEVVRMMGASHVMHDGGYHEPWWWKWQSSWGWCATSLMVSRWFQAGWGTSIYQTRHMLVVNWIYPAMWFIWVFPAAMYCIQVVFLHDQSLSVVVWYHHYSTIHHWSWSTIDSQYEKHNYSKCSLFISHDQASFTVVNHERNHYYLSS